MTDVCRSREEWTSRRPRGGTLGLVPTMGALHAGHVSLIERCAADNDAVVVSIFVNPTQFDDAADLAAYPRTIEEDLAELDSLGVGFAFLPAARDIYPDEARFKVCETEFSRRLCGAHRPGHFDGVLNVVARLFALTRPDRAYFGEKDFQQLVLVRDMAALFFPDVAIVGCPTVREADGLALSSRNRLLSEEARRRATAFPNTLANAASTSAARSELESLGFQVDYVEDLRGRRFGAVRIDGVRLIDNLPLDDPA